MLARYLEDEGLATTQIALVREHAQAIRPPRALWVPFPLGRPLGAVDDAPFQRRVLRAALDLLDAEAGPVLADFPDDAPDDPAGDEAVIEGMACPLPMEPPPEDGLDQGHGAGLVAEVARLGPWYDLGAARRGRTTVGVSGLAIEDAARFVGQILDDAETPSPCPGLSRGEALKLACEDVRAYCMEAVAEQPGRLTIEERDDWFWNASLAGKVFWALAPVCRASPDSMMRAMGDYILVPRAQLKSVGANPEYEA